jgi:hypothetical protein
VAEEQDDFTGLLEKGSVLPEAVNQPLDCPTIIVEGILGVAIGSNVTKVNFVEHIPYVDKLLARHVVNLAIPNDQFVKIVKGLQKVLEGAGMTDKDEQ